MEKYYDEKLNSKKVKELGIVNYDVLKCSQCQLEFSNPLVPGNDAFYEWITNHEGYYPENRWEWFEVRDRIKKNKKPISVLEIGCGNGLFLQLIKKLNNINAMGLDITSSVSEICRRKKLNVYNGTIESFRLKNSKLRFDYIVCFHCLEHISNPRKFIDDMVSLLSPGGTIFLSTPYSPLIFEPLWFDPLNHPPHHMTRWDINAFRKLADQFNMQVNFSSPLPEDVVKRTFYSINLAWNSRSKLLSPPRLLLKSFCHPVFTIKEFLRQQKRDIVNGQVVSNVILVEMKSR